jgi:hypothetical protein
MREGWLLHKYFLPYHHEVLLYVLESEPESFLLGSVLSDVHFINGFGCWVVDFGHHGGFRNGVALIVDEVYQLFSHFVWYRFVFFPHVYSKLCLFLLKL